MAVVHGGYLFCFPTINTIYNYTNIIPIAQRVQPPTWGLMAVAGSRWQWWQVVADDGVEKETKRVAADAHPDE